MGSPTYNLFSNFSPEFYRDNSLPYMRVVLVLSACKIHKLRLKQPLLLINSECNWCQITIVNKMLLNALKSDFCLCINKIAPTF